MIQETVEQLKARVRREDAEADAARKKQIEDANAPTRNRNAEFFAKEAEREDQAKNNKPVVAAPKTQEQIVAEHAERYPYNTSGKAKGGVDPLMDRESDASKRAAGYVSPTLKPSIAMQPVPDPYPSSDPRHGMSRELILKMGMNP